MEERGLAYGVSELERLRHHGRRVFPYQCVRLRHRNATCSLCADHCPTGAIAWGDAPQVNADACADCGLCATVCPTGVFETAGPSNTALLEHIQALATITSTLAFACPNVSRDDAPGVIRVSCLGRVDASILIGAAAAGIRQIEMWDAECPGCPTRIGHAVAERAVASSNQILQACGSPASVAFARGSGVPDHAAPGLEQAACSGPKSLPEEAPQASQTLPKGELPVRLPEKLELLLASLRRLAGRAVSAESTTTLWGTVGVDGACTGCQMCAFFCPTGALAKSVADGLPGLTFTPAHCTYCRLCLESCYMSSIVLSPRVDLGEVTSLTSRIVWSNIQSASYQEKVKRLRAGK